MADLLSGVWGTQVRTEQFSPADWEKLIGQARRARLLPRLARHFEDQDGGLAALPSPQQHHLRGALLLVQRQRHEVLAEVAHMRRALRGLATPVVLLKGAAYLFAELPPARARIFSDLDIMVERDQIAVAEGALLAGGWISEERDAYNQRYYREWMHEVPPLRHVQRGSVIDLHHTIAPPTSRFKVDAKRLLERVRPVGSSGLFVLGPEDMVLHSALHLYQESEFDHGLRDLLDLRDLLLHFAREPAFWPALLARARELRLEEPLFHLLHQVQRLFGLPLPREATDALAAYLSRGLATSLVATLLEQAVRPNHPSCDSPTARLARWLLYVRSHWLRMPLHLLLPHLIRKAYRTRFPAQTGIQQTG
jgi:hypothetical protein